MVQAMPNEPPMEINLELIQQLCLEAGRIMEEHSAELAFALPRSSDVIKARVAPLHRAATAIMALANAVRALVDHEIETPDP
jgi:hypothetical protein